MRHAGRRDQASARPRLPGPSDASPSPCRALASARDNIMSSQQDWAPESHITTRTPEIYQLPTCWANLP